MVTHDVYMYIVPIHRSLHDAMTFRMKRVNIILRYVCSFMALKSSGSNLHFHAL